jgi:hypothetical protein
MHNKKWELKEERWQSVMLKFKLLVLLLLMFALIFTGCSPSKDDVLENSQDWDFEVNKVHNSEPTLLKYIQKVTIHSENDKLKWLNVLGLKENRPVILIFDTEKMVFHTNDPEELREFAKTLEE